MDLFDVLKNSGHGGKNERRDEKNGKSSSKKGGDKKFENKLKNLEQRLAKFNDKHKSNYKSSRRESMPSPVSHAILSKNKKARSLSPPKYAGSAVIKSLKVKVERKNLLDFLKSPLVQNTKNVKSKNYKSKVTNEPNQKSPVKPTPTKAQQKLFEPIASKRTKEQTLKEFNIKKCKVRIRRDNLKQLMVKFKNSNKSNTKQSTSKTSAKAPKRIALSDDDGSPPLKKGKASPPKGKMNFFFKITPHKLDKKSKLSPRPSSSSSVAHHNKIRNSKSHGITTPTKFSRSHLIRTFGKRYFTSFVRIEKCHHPLLLTFESNDRARRLQTKRNKSKNLSVSFREQVEIFGSGSDSDNSYDENFCVIPPTNQKGGRRSNSSSVALAIASATPVVMPARLKKVENGKVVDDIELDPSLFLDPKNIIASSPYSPGRKKRDRKSFSPLKDEGTPSPRKEKLKLANEKIPPSGLRRINIDDDDDEDDDCEYIVPIELPQRRTSRTNSANTSEYGPTMFPPAPQMLNVSDSCSNTQDKNIEIDAGKTATANELDSEAIETISPQSDDIAPAPIISTSSPKGNVNTSPIENSDIPESAEPKVDPEEANAEEAIAKEAKADEANADEANADEANGGVAEADKANEEENNADEVNEGEVNADEANEGEVNADEANEGEVNADEANEGEINADEANEGEDNADEANEGEVNADEANEGEVNADEANEGEVNADEANVGEVNADEANEREANADEANKGEDNADEVNEGESNADEDHQEVNEKSKIPSSIESNETEKAQPETGAVIDDNESRDSFHSASDQDPQLKENGGDSNLDNTLIPASASNDVLVAVVATAIDSESEAKQTQDKSELDSLCAVTQMLVNSEQDSACKMQDMTELDSAHETPEKLELDSASESKEKQVMAELNGIDVSPDDMSMNLFLDDSQADSDGPEKSFVDSIINETIDKLGKDIEESGPADEQPAHTT